MQRGFQLHISNRIGNSVDPDETAHDEPSHLDLHCLQKYMYSSVGMKGLICFTSNTFIFLEVLRWIFTLCTVGSFEYFDFCFALCKSTNLQPGEVKPSRAEPGYALSLQTV